MLYRIILIIKQINNVLYYSKKVFKLPNKNKLIILDEVGSNKIADHILGHNDFTIMHPKTDTLNVPIFFYSLFSFFTYKKFTYEVCFIKYVGAQFAITWIDTTYNYCNILSFIPSCKLGLIQNGRSHDGRFNFLNGKRLKCDYYYITGSYVQSYFEKHLEAKYVVSGSPIANNFKLSCHKPIEKIQWISQFRNPDNTGASYFQKMYELGTEFSLGIIERFCKSKNIKLEIMSFTGSSFEQQFYDNIVKDYTFLKSDYSLYPYDSYSWLSSKAIIAGMDSALLYEAFGLKYRTAIFSFLGSYMNDGSRNFAWPKKTKDSGPFWTNVPQKDNIKNILEYLINVKKNEWEKEKEQFNGVMFQNPSNVNIRKILGKENVKLATLKF